MKAIFAALCFVACSSSNAATPGNTHGNTPDAGTDAPVDAAAEAGCRSPYAQGPGKDAPEWCAVDQVLSDSLASADASTAQLPGFAFQVVSFDSAKGEPVLRYSRAEGTVSGAPANVTTAVRTASGAKLMTALLIARAAQVAKDAGGPSLSPQTTVDVLGCTGLPAGVAGTPLDDLMHQIAGLDAKTDNACVTSAKISLHDCACSILHDNYIAAQDGSFAYTPHNFVVSAAIADAVLGQLSTPRDIRTVFHNWLGELGIPLLEALLPITNNFAGGDRISAHAYAALLSLALPGPARGQYHGKQLLDPAILDRLTVPYGDNVTITLSPYMLAAGFPIRYGFGDWVQCSNAWPEPAAWPPVDKAIITLDYAGCPYRAVNSLGKFGYMPWFVPRASKPYDAVLTVDLANSATGGRVSIYSFAAYEMLDPVIRAAIDASP